MLRDMHIRLNELEYDFLCALSDRLHCSQADVIRMAVYDKDMREIVKTYRDQRCTDSRYPVYTVMTLDEETTKLLTESAEVMNKIMYALRYLGNRFRSIEKLVDKGKISKDTAEKIHAALDAMVPLHERAMRKHGEVAERLAEFACGRISVKGQFAGEKGA